MTARLTRVSAYAVCRRAEEILLVHQVAPGPARDRWTLPGGGIDFGEHPADAVRREVAEETGAAVDLGELLAVHDNVYSADDGIERHGLRLLFAATLTSALRPPRTGEIDQVAWWAVAGLPSAITDWAALAAGLAFTDRA